ncbi:cell division regulator GpsB [Ureibacillus sp. FSL K6-8385]|uniref:Cell division regulator GpsB n=1 Tax=Ureibacillus terrenus TaxID=118246 RepID=A0A540V6E9_9BACL|nr:cell division regulator GpsB [Ureibacillus terrenus]MED3660668.1 cell division regulator GpsB [Ureibacillus terrenus]MED3762788.1 cell division regulator GpsB [Ureibacillus terrenus]TQE92340.1 cell division regulator GpsB [Ureibacillus terrenus]
MEIKLNSKMILEKEFKRQMKGYNIDEVDQFLDIIMEDYDNFNKMIKELQEENERLKKEIETLKKQQTPQYAGSTNFDILKRLSNLEKHVFGNKLYD